MVVQASTATQAKCMLPIGEMPTWQDRQEALPTSATRKYKYVGCSFVANHGTQEALYARGMHIGHNWRTYMAGDASVRSTIRPKHPKGTASESAVEREKRITLTCPWYLLGAIMYEKEIILCMDVVCTWYVPHPFLYMYYVLFGITYYVAYR